MKLNEVTLIIPAYEPDEKLTETIDGAISIGFTDIIVVDDGSSESCSAVFGSVEARDECTLLRHGENRGKGAALKTAFTYFFKNRKNFCGAVTADADGQHLAHDIAAVAEAMINTDKIILGVRDFSLKDIPRRSRNGNRITSAVFRILFGMKLSDTQTGLRAIPRKYISDIVTASGDRYEYETNMLILMNKRSIPFEEVKISTVYIDSNNSSHFRVVRDSIRIYSLIIKYVLSSSVSALTDEIGYYIFKKIDISALIFGSAVSTEFSTFIAGGTARLIASALNYIINSRVVFKDKTGPVTLLKYYAVAILQCAVSLTLVSGAEILLAVDTPFLSTLIKVVVDLILFFISFRIQNNWVFAGERVKNSEEALS
ncbi:MAG: glycosyltransferase [Clostridiales bacterium]|nr:glycosyltransferase [Clostridiales bacterium]